MYNNITVVISCAGMGKRLGMGIPKALLEIDGKPLIIRHLELLKECSDIRIVVGYKANDVIDVVTKFRKDVTFVFNQDYMNNGTGASVCLAAKHANEYIVTIDGDLLIHPDDVKKILDYKDEFIGVCHTSTDNPVLTSVSNGKVILFSREKGEYEWTGVSKFKTENLIKGTGHVYQLLESFLPIDYLLLRTKEIDTPNDRLNAIKWVKNNFSDNITIGIVGGMGSIATVNFFDRLVHSFKAEKEWERPRIIVDNRCSMPSRVRAILYNERTDELINSLNESVHMMLENNCDYIVLACNTSHYFLDSLSISDENRSKIVSIIYQCIDELKNKNVKDVKLLASEGTILSGIYNKELEKNNISYEQLNEEDYNKFRNWIEDVKQNKITDNTKEEFINYINQSTSDNIILGCTELPILYTLCSDKITKNIYDPLECTIKFLDNKQNEKIE